MVFTSARMVGQRTTMKIRDTEKVLSDILTHIASGETVKTRLSYRTFTSSNKIDEYLDLLLSRGLIDMDNGGPRITNKGMRYIDLRRRIDDILGKAITGNGEG